MNTKNIKTKLTGMVSVVCQLAFCIAAFTSCADDFDRSFETARPGNAADYAYLNGYKPLKDYVATPGFKLGVGVEVQDYLRQELVYALTNSNFTEVVPGNAMKMASCVADDGSMDFGEVSQFVSMASDAGLSLYGHTLAWHSQQPVTPTRWRRRRSTRRTGPLLALTACGDSSPRPSLLAPRWAATD